MACERAERRDRCAYFALWPMKRRLERGITASKSDSDKRGRPTYRERMPIIWNSSLRVIPDFEPYRLSRTSSALLPKQETMP